ncbi:MAG TPA: WXG100 family type VII secretion target [Solirubrobacteraceae bacterium]|nr:WXG100 family type VII secretion target [Solirubrobacteraceae bacterium]
MAFIKVTAEELSSTASQLTAAAAQIEAENSQAMSQVQALVGAGWQGAASGAFEAAFAQWKTGADQVQSALAQISSLLNNAAGTYDSTEQQIASSFGG